MSRFFRDSERVFAEALNQIVYANPFDREKVGRLEQAALSVELPAAVMEFAEPAERIAEYPEFAILAQRAECLAEAGRLRLAKGTRPEDRDSVLHRNLVFFILYFRFRFDFQKSIEDVLAKPQPEVSIDHPGRVRHLRVAYFDRFAAVAEKFLGPTMSTSDSRFSVDHRFAICFQIRRAFHFIHEKIRGRSKAMDRLRAEVWQSIFTHDMVRYDASLHDRMHDITTLITGPSGTGKDLVAEAIGQSRYIRFDIKKKAFEENVVGAFHPVNLSAIPAELIEAELFGNCKGAFTGAVQDRIGWLELCGPFHSVFLDEIGELSQSIQVKLLRVLQNRTFQRVGETASRRFEGKVIAATNRDLDEEMRAGRFRGDFYYRLCSDRIQTPSLREQLDDRPDDLPFFVATIARRLIGDASDSLAKEVVAWIDQNLPRNYSWPGNVRELEQCTRNILVRNAYRPPLQSSVAAVDKFTHQLKGRQLTADELLSWYCTLTYAETGNYSETARRLNIDRRTVQRRIDNRWLDSRSGGYG